MDEILNLIESVSEGFPTYSSIGPCPTIIQVSRRPDPERLPSTFARLITGLIFDLYVSYVDS